jgi:hypothetical protein
MALADLTFESRYVRLVFGNDAGFTSSLFSSPRSNWVNRGWIRFAETLYVRWASRRRMIPLRICWQSYNNCVD